jgi:uncharacterized DUF497 family protein
MTQSALRRTKNLRKHGVSFDEAATAFADLHSITVPDPEHSEGEWRYYLLGMSDRANLLVVCHTDRGDVTPIFSAWRANRRQRVNMRKNSGRSSSASPVPDIDFSGGVRGKYAARYAAGTNLVLLSPDVAEIFPDSAAVNEALRTLVRLSGKTIRVRTSPKRKRRLTPRQTVSKRNG